MKNAQTHYEVLGVNWDATGSEFEDIYYQLARRYHPDRFRKAAASLVPRLEAAFARITQAYDTLRDDNLRANYNSKLEARRKAEQLADSAPKATTPQRRNQLSKALPSLLFRRPNAPRLNLKKDLRRSSWAREK